MKKSLLRVFTIFVLVIATFISLPNAHAVGSSGSSNNSFGGGFHTWKAEYVMCITAHGVDIVRQCDQANGGCFDQVCPCIIGPIEH